MANKSQKQQDLEVVKHFVNSGWTQVHTTGGNGLIFARKPKIVEEQKVRITTTQQKTVKKIS